MDSIALTEQEARSLLLNYQQLHRTPELSMRESKTAAGIEARLKELGIESFRCGGTGVVGVQRNGDGPVVAYRADTDGLPIKEETGAPYASAVVSPGPDGIDLPVMHGCGHDAHVAVALAAAAWLAARPDSWSGTVVWVFQPGEETAAGAAAMVDDGLWARAPRPSVIFGQHIIGGFEAGHVALRSGPAMAMADSLRVTIFGKQAHASEPQAAIDPILLGATIVVRLQMIVARETDPRSPVVVSCGTFNAGLKENIIPDRAELTLNIRTLSESERERVLGAIRRVVHGEAIAAGAPEPVMEEFSHFPLLVNDPAWTAETRNAIIAELGQDHVSEPRVDLGSEDFGWLGQSINVPSVYWYFGAHAPDSGERPGNHSPYFLPDAELALPAGVRAALAALLAALQASSQEDQQDFAPLDGARKDNP